jgi:hypothetical protein
MEEKIRRSEGMVCQEDMLMTTQTIQKRAHEVMIYDRLYRVAANDLVCPDEWAGPARLEVSDWEKAEFYLPSYRYEGVVIAVNIKVTGRTFQRRPYSDRYWVRVQVEFLRDDEPSEFASAWWAPEGGW